MNIRLFDSAESGSPKLVNDKVQVRSHVVEAEVARSRRVLSHALRTWGSRSSCLLNICKFLSPGRAHFAYDNIDILARKSDFISTPHIESTTSSFPSALS